MTWENRIMHAKDGRQRTGGAGWAPSASTALKRADPVVERPGIPAYNSVPAIATAFAPKPYASPIPLGNHLPTASLTTSMRD